MEKVLKRPSIVAVTKEGGRAFPERTIGERTTLGVSGIVPFCKQEDMKAIWPNLLVTFAMAEPSKTFESPTWPPPRHTSQLLRGLQRTLEDTSHHMPPSHPPQNLLAM